MQMVCAFVDGQWISNPGGGRFLSINPATEKTLATVEISAEGTVEAAIVAARRVADGSEWPLSAETRAAYLHAFADALEERADLLAEIESKDTGMTLMMTAGGHVPRAVAHFRYYAGEVERISAEFVDTGSSYRHAIEQRPLGVVAVISPWNAPLAVSSLHIAAALAAGNAIVLKPSERASLSAHSLSEIAKEIGLPPGVLNIVYGPGQPTGACLVRHTGVDVVGFIGGNTTGGDIVKETASSCKRVLLELGGKSPTIVLADAPFEKALDGALLSVFGSNGEMCTAGSRILVEKELYAPFLSAFSERAQSMVVGNPLDPRTEIGPLIDRAHLERVLGYVELGRKEGARLVCGGNRPPGLPTGYFMAPAVFSDVSPTMRIAREEIFGPVAAVMAVGSVEEALRVANDTSFGLAATVWTSDVCQALRLSRSLRSGVVGVNTPIVRDLRVPFGGMKASGRGRIGGRWGMEAYSEVQVTILALDPYPLPRYGIVASGRGDSTAMRDLTRIPPDLPVPTDDGACNHLLGASLPSIGLPSTDGCIVDLSKIPAWVAVFAYPRTGRPGYPPLVPDWDSIPGARGCTPQTLAYEEHAEWFRQKGCQLFGLSTQSTEYQSEMARRLRLSFPILSDEKRELVGAMRLPTLTVAGEVLVRRLSWWVWNGRIAHVFYPVFPPDENAREMTSWWERNRREVEQDPLGRGSR